MLSRLLLMLDHLYVLLPKHSDRKLMVSLAAERQCSGIHEVEACNDFDGVSIWTLCDIASAKLILHRILSCKQYAIGSNGTIEVQYSAGGRAAIFALSADLVGSKICATDGATDPATPGTAVSSVTSDGIPRLILSSPTLLSFIVILLGQFTFRV